MENILTFIIPVRHQDNSRNWEDLKKNLTATMKSISSQESNQWKAVIVANHGADLPALPDQFEVKWVDFPPNQFYERGSVEEEAYTDALRFDKGRRVLAGMLHAGKMKHVMIVDDDDFVSSKLTSFVSQNQSANGWYIKNGYVWAQNSKVLYLYSDFLHLCGTSFIIRSDLYQLPETLEAASDDSIKQLFGSHLFIRDHLEKMGTPLARLPFVGAIYRIGHPNSCSKSKSSLILILFTNKWFIRHPLVLLHRILFLRLHWFTKDIRKEFLGVGREIALLSHK